MEGLKLPELEAITDAAHNISKKAIRTPLVKLNQKHTADQPNTYLKLESLQPIGSLKVRPSVNALACIEDKSVLHEKGVCTASAGNFAQGLAWGCSDIGVRCRVVVPQHAPESKLAAIRGWNAEVIRVPFAEWWDIIETHTCPQAPGAHFIHPGADNSVLAGNATIALEIVEDLPEVDCIVAPYGSGALVTGIASGIKTLIERGKVTNCLVVAAEPETASPFSLSMQAGQMEEFVGYQASFVDGCGGKRVLPQIWELARKVVARGCSVPVADVADAVKLLVERNHVVAEGAGACSVAAALGGMCGPDVRNIVCVVPGSGIDTKHLITCLQGDVPAVEPGQEFL